MTQYQIINTQSRHAPTIAAISYCDDPDDETVFHAHHIRAHVQRFPQGQFTALCEGRVVGYATTMRTNRPPSARPLPWLQAVGDMRLSAHHPRGEWLYGVDFYVHPDFRRRGIGSALYRARFDLVKRLGLKGFYAGGMLAGYHRYCQQMTASDYGERVRRREITDPTITMQMNRGFRPQGVIENYVSGLPAYSSAMLIVWDNPTATGVN